MSEMPSIHLNDDRSLNTSASSASSPPTSPNTIKANTTAPLSIISPTSSALSSQTSPRASTPTSANSPNSPTISFSTSNATQVYPNSASSVNPSSLLNRTSLPSSSASTVTPTANIHRAQESSNHTSEPPSSFEVELEILNQERDELERKFLIAEEERMELQRTLDESMHSYQVILDESTQRKNDYVAHMGIVEAEMSHLRIAFENEQTEKSSLLHELQTTRSLADEKMKSESNLNAALQQATAELEEVKQKYEELRNTATAKLKASAQEYMGIRQREQEKDLLLSEIRRELQAATEQNLHQQSRLKETDEMCNKLKLEVNHLDTNLKATQHELINVTTQLTTCTAAANEYKGQMEEYAAISQRYKTQLLEQRERIRVLENSASKHEHQESDFGKIMSELEMTVNENRTLKSQLYDSMQVEQQLRNKLEGSGKEIPESIVDVTRLRQTEQEISQLKAELQAKTAENNELLAMVDSLIRQVEEKDQTF